MFAHHKIAPELLCSDSAEDASSEPIAPEAESAPVQACSGAPVRLRSRRFTRRVEIARAFAWVLTSTCTSQAEVGAALDKHRQHVARLLRGEDPFEVAHLTMLSGEVLVESVMACVIPWMPHGCVEALYERIGEFIGRARASAPPAAQEMTLEEWLAAIGVWKRSG